SRRPGARRPLLIARRLPARRFGPFSRRVRLQPADRDPGHPAARPARQRSRQGPRVKGVGLRSPGSTAISLLVPLGLVGIIVLLGAAAAPSIQDTLPLLLCNLIIVLGLQIFIGNSGVYSFGQIGFAAIDAYTAALLTLPAAFALLQTP